MGARSVGRWLFGGALGMSSSPHLDPGLDFPAYSVVYLLRAGHLGGAKRKLVDLLHSQITAAGRWGGRFSLSLFFFSQHCF